MRTGLTILPPQARTELAAGLRHFSQKKTHEQKKVLNVEILKDSIKNSSFLRDIDVFF
jgi:hypothetical protein